jgi:hypothetical protein
MIGLSESSEFCLAIIWSQGCDNIFFFFARRRPRNVANVNLIGAGEPTRAVGVVNCYLEKWQLAEVSKI